MLNYGDEVQVTSGDHAGRTGAVVGMSDSGVSVTVEFGDGTDAELPRASLEWISSAVG